MDTMTWFLEMYTTWFYFVVNYDDPAALAELSWCVFSLYRASIAFDLRFEI